MPYSVFSSTGAGSRQRSKRGSSERPGPRFDHDRVRTPRESELDSEDVFSVLRPISGAPSKGDNGAERDAIRTRKSRPKFLDGLLFKGDLPADDGDSWVDTDSVDGSESGHDPNGEF